jgi:hypothetical protein
LRFSGIRVGNQLIWTFWEGNWNVGVPALLSGDRSIASAASAAHDRLKFVSSLARADGSQETP